MSYDLSRLSYAEFEALSRDLVSRAIGSRLEAFAEGRDDGIDGRHISTDGQIIFQAKHLGRSGFSALKAKMRKERGKINRLCPDRYVLATSVPLSPRNKAALGEVIGPALLGSGDIFGPDDPLSLLHENEDLVRAYPALWMHSGTVLKDMLEASLDHAAERLRLGLAAIQSAPIPIVDTIHCQLERTSNPRFGFSFLHPVVWDRHDPTNGDGNTFSHPKDPRIEIRAWGGYAVLCPEFDDRVAQSIEWCSEEVDFELLADVYSGGCMIDFIACHGDTFEEVCTPIEGRRIVYRSEKGGNLTCMRIFLQMNDTQFGLQCQAPTEIFDLYEDLFLTISKGMYVLGPASAPSARGLRDVDQSPPLWRRVADWFRRN